MSLSSKSNSKLNFIYKRKNFLSHAELNRILFNFLSVTDECFFFY